MVDETEEVEETQTTAAPEPKEIPKQIDKEKPPFTVPLKELDVGKAGVSDLFDKCNEIVRFLNALDIEPTKD